MIKKMSCILFKRKKKHEEGKKKTNNHTKSENKYSYYYLFTIYLYMITLFVSLIKSHTHTSSHILLGGQDNESQHVPTSLYSDKFRRIR